MHVDFDQARYRERSLWLEGCASLKPRPTISGDVGCDVAIVGAGFTGLWSAYYLKRLAPDLRVVVLEREIAGFGPSGRNGGWASAGIAASPKVYLRRHGAGSVLRAERETFATVGEIGRVAALESIDCGFVHGGTVTVATTRPQLARLKASVDARRARGFTADDVRLLEASELDERVRVAGALAGAFTPHTARIDPARLVRGLADACERLGVMIFERSEARRIGRGRVECATGAVVRASHVLRTTEAYTTELAGEKRRFLPLYSLMIATEPLSSAIWEEIGWERGETINDQRHLFFYAQRTSDDRIAIGGRGAPYRLGSPIDEVNERNDVVRERLAATVRRHFPAARDAAVTHHWGGPLGVPRDWSMAVCYDVRSGLGWAGGYAGHGVVAANIAGRTLADLLLDRQTDLVSLPWVGHQSRRWEPEPIRFLASRAIVGVLGSADRHEDTTDRPARRVRLVAPFVLPR